VVKLRSKEKLVAIFLSETIPSLFKWSGLVLMVYFGSIAIRSLSGKTTVSNIVFKFIEQADSLKAETFLTIFSIMAVIWALTERKIRHYKIKKCYTRVTELEKKLDRERTTSGLTLEGKTNPGDLK